MASIDEWYEDAAEDLTGESNGGEAMLEQIEEDGEPDLETAAYEEDDDILDAAELLDAEAFPEGNRRERANSLRSSRNAKAIKLINRRVKSNTRLARHANSSASRAYKRHTRFERRYLLDERRERRARIAVIREVRSCRSRIDEIQEQRLWQAMFGLFSNRIVSLELEGKDSQNPRDTYQVHAQQNDLMGTMMPMMMQMMGSSGSSNSGMSMMFPMMMMMFAFQGAQGGQALGNNPMILMLPMMMMMTTAARR